MFPLLMACQNLRKGLFLKKKRHLKHVLGETRDERQARIRKENRHELITSIKSQGVGYNYDFRIVKKHKPKRVFGPGFYNW